MGASMGTEDGAAPEGASDKKPMRMLELRLSPPQMEPPRGRNGQPLRLLAKVGLAAHGRDAATEVPWEEAIPLPLPSDRAAILISLYSFEANAGGGGVARLLTELCLPAYSGPGGLALLGLGIERPLGLHLALTMGSYYVPGQPLDEVAARLADARERFRPDGPSLAISLREVAVTAAELEGSMRLRAVQGQGQGSRANLGDSVASLPASLDVPQSKRQVITLELQNAQLANRLRSAGVVVADDKVGVPSHVRQLTELQRENEQLRTERHEMSKRLDFLKAALAQPPRTQSSEASAEQDGNRDWGRTLRVMEQELAHSLERRRKIQANFEERVRTLQDQLQDAVQQQAESKVLGTSMDPDVAAMRGKIEEAMRRRDELMRQWREVREAAHDKNGDPQRSLQQSASPEIQRLLAQSQHYKAEIHALEQELALRRDQDQGSQRQQELRGNISQLYEELDELQRVREDERVRGESEVRELTRERDLARDRLADASAELQRLRAKAEAMRSLQPEDVGDTSSLEPLRAQHAELVAELARLRQIEEVRKQSIQDLEREQEALVEKTSMLTLQAMPYTQDSLRGGALGASQGEEQVRSLEAKVADLRTLLVKKQDECQDLENSVLGLQEQAQEASQRSQVLRENYEALQQSADDRMLRNPAEQPAQRTMMANGGGSGYSVPASSGPL
eukprot:TRINITY_DN45655_c0_g1_i1.p1 TRINITY_DN45655_c0_g1~~TRINITY_DN45655_c0_g1_i1.p1  ORF type:complete len:681 (+),score=204.19 TRINITY_DN45655_c0_g1_i1:119-2161(+)